MENHIETNFRAIQRILDSCVAHDYKTKVDALFLKREYLTKAQIKDYLRQEIFRVTENIVAIQQKYLQKAGSHMIQRHHQNGEPFQGTARQPLCP